MADTFRIVIFLSGRGSNFVAIADRLAADSLPIEIAGVVSDRSSAAGLDEARQRGIPTTVVARKKSERSVQQFQAELLEAANSYRPDLVVLAGFMRVLSEEFVDALAGKVINIHPSLLPAFKGLHPHEQALAAGARFSGCSVHYVTNELDGGPIIAQAVVPVHEADDADSLAARVLVQEHQLYPAVVAGIASGQISLQQGRIHIDPTLQLADPSAHLRSIALPQ